MDAITRIIKLGHLYHAIILDKDGKIHHKIFSEERRASDYIEGHYRGYKRIVKYEV